MLCDVDDRRDAAIAQQFAIRDGRVSAEGPLGTRSAYLRQRIFECIPAALLGLTLPMPLLLRDFSPWIAYLILCGYVIYLAALSVDMAFRQAAEFLRMRRIGRIDWPHRLSGLSNPYQRLRDLDRLPRLNRSEREERAGLLAWIRDGEAPDPSLLWHLVLIPVANEGPEVLTTTLEAILVANYPLTHLAVCVSFEARSGKWTDEAIDRLLDPYRDRFGMLLALRHPDGLPGEAKVKGANITWAAKRARTALHSNGIADEHIVVSVFDCDTRAGRDYFPALAWNYLTDPGRDVNSYQPIVLFHNNLWEVPAVSRLIGYMATMWNMADSTRTGRMRIFSSHAAGMRALVRIDFWAINVVPDDSRQHWRFFYGTDGRSTTRPLHVPVYLDAVRGDGYLKTLVEQYLQIRRWNYGVIDFPYIMAQNVANARISLPRRALQTYRQLSDFHRRAITPLLLFLVSQIIKRLGTPTLLHASAAAAVAGWLQSWTWAVGLVSLSVGMVIAFALLPDRPRHHSVLIYLKLCAEWVLLPVVLPVFFSLSALEVQLRLVLRRYLGFRVTAKTRAPALTASAPVPTQSYPRS